MKLLRGLLTTVVVASLLAVLDLVQSVQNCTSPEGENKEERDKRVAAFRATVFSNICALSEHGTGRSEFRNQTRFNHGVTGLCEFPTLAVYAPVVLCVLHSHVRG